MEKIKQIQFSIDRGGTFTDVYAEVPGEEGGRVTKLLSEDPANYDDAPREGIRRILEAVTGENLSSSSFSSAGIDWIRMGTTVATNALLERKGARCVLLISQGFKDLLRIGNQTRPKIFDLKIEKPDLLYESVLEVEERVRLLGRDESRVGKDIRLGLTDEELVILKKPNPEQIKKQLQFCWNQGIRSIAVVLMHAYTFVEHERLIGEIAEKIGFSQISLSHEVMPVVKIVGRGDTTMVDAYLTPHIKTYLKSFKRGFSGKLKRTKLLFMQSDGGLVDADQFKGSNAILSGPAGGVVGYAMTTFNKKTNQPVIGFDMGGTSTDVSRFGGEYELVHETEMAGVRIQAPQMNIKTVAAGGGSRLFYRNGMLETGPESAGAHPGPVCYRKNGYLTVTDANLFLGRIQPEFFPKIFGKTEDQPLDYDAVKIAFYDLTKRINEDYKIKNLKIKTPEETALGFLEVANEVMVRPIREISVMRGYDVKEHILACFGGAGGQHACSVARDLGISSIFIHRFSGILSAYGMGLADIVVERQEPSALTYGESTIRVLLEHLEQLKERAKRALLNQGCEVKQLQFQYFLNLRFDGTDTSMMVQRPEDNDFEHAFRENYFREFGFELTDRKIVVDDIRIRGVAKAREVIRPVIAKASTPPTAVSVKPCYFEGGWQETKIFLAEDLGAGQIIQGPAILMQDASTVLIEPECYAEITDFGDIQITVSSRQEKKLDSDLDPIRLSIFSNLFMSIAEQMGRTLERTSISTNIKERLDFSCAIFDRTGGLVANAPHIPVHLGAMGEAVKQQILLQGKTLKEGDVLVTNHPAMGGSHLPDITVISPVWKEGEPIFYVASRGHHADIGGISPGSMPPFSKELKEEGACIKSFKLVENGEFKLEGITALLQAPGKLECGEGQLPISGTRRLSDNISDLKAQVAANQSGIDLLMEMVDTYSLKVVSAYMRYIQDNAGNAVRKRLIDLAKEHHLEEVGSIRAEDCLDDGSIIQLKLTIDPKDGDAVFDFSGTGCELPGNLNTPVAVTHSVILYALRCLVAQDIPLNQGCLEPITIILEKGSLLDPSEFAAVVGGNVLTSQRITDVIFKAFNVVSASQGCMNNLTFGNSNFGYYETIGGGAGAGKNWDGQSGVQTHMTNTRITDPEILERRYPVMLREFSIRSGSGGAGRFRGGDGLIRELEFLEPLKVAIMSERRVFAPFGLEGGESGAKGKNLFIPADGDQINLGGKNEIQAKIGDRLRILTPGGGGFGQSSKK